ncbi:MAG TPA: FmdB family zinc ribbon protein [Bryobacteraceae bacterium]|nr:FmdB family zinc ribbon protein [Bryobacteraceae bacterium]
MTEPAKIRVVSSGLSMPLYEYKCHSCGEKFEVIQKFSDTPLAAHDKCGGPVERLISPSALKFKGSGWYVTDYAGSGNGKSQPAKDGNKDGKDGGKASAQDSGKESKKEGSAGKDAPAKSETKASSTPTPASSDKKV